MAFQSTVDTVGPAPSNPSPRSVDNHPTAFDPLVESEAFDLVGILSAVEETAYVWDISAGRVDWESNVFEVLGFEPGTNIRDADLYHSMISAEHMGRRLALMSADQTEDDVRGTPYRVQYRLKPKGLRSSEEIFVEDQGRWWSGVNGKPIRARGVVRVVPESYVDEQRLLFQSEVDELTGQLNRIKLTEAMAAVIGRASEHNTSAAFLVVAINNLAVINETFGFDIGDEVISHIGRAIRDKLRGGDTLGRYSSNKFGVLIQDCAPGAMRIAAERIMKAVRNQVFSTTAGQLSVTVSIGGVIVPHQAKTVQAAIDAALRALDVATTKRQDHFVAYSEDAGAEKMRSKSRSIADHVLTALDERRMRLVLQPMVSAQTGTADIYECLLRMEKPDGSLIAAGEFITVAEQLGLSRLIDRRTLELSIDLLRAHKDLTLSVNVSALTCTDQEWLDTLRRLSGGNSDLLRRMIVEITETAVIQDVDQSVAFVDTLKELGCRVAIDDFGAGYTSFKNLKMLNVDMVKIDGIFVKNVVNDSSDQIFVKTMIDLANSLGLETVAEWVGDEDCVRYLQSVGVTYLQGFYYGMPIDASDYRSQSPGKLSGAA